MASTAADGRVTVYRFTPGRAYAGRPGAGRAGATMAELTMTRGRLSGVTVIALKGELTVTNQAVLRAYLDQARRRPDDQVVLDLSELTFMDSTGLRELLLCRGESVEHGGELRLAALRAAPSRLIQITGLDVHLSVHVTVEQAVAAARRAAAAQG
ncbi:STAS domain-containing protein [Nonomuraea sp. NN258]|uniref:STAS domain-containing protein n=1 Tax=Nonomuraea antri TaxID=2730852 RepID=UPI00156912B8|nr:STAS domain-containing protein [Nonomuraea antri]NRQ38763.1 STAS domain-containing protein [Nonomuraea antri]